MSLTFVFLMRWFKFLTMRRNPLKGQSLVLSMRCSIPSHCEIRITSFVNIITSKKSYWLLESKLSKKNHLKFLFINSRVWSRINLPKSPQSLAKSLSKGFHYLIEKANKENLYIIYSPQSIQISKSMTQIITNRSQKLQKTEMNISGKTLRKWTNNN